MSCNTKVPTIVAALATVVAAAAATFAALPGGANAATPKLVATVGPGYTITLRTTSGAPARTMKAGVYAITVRDRSEEHNFHLTGAGVDKATSVDWVGTKTWRVRVVRGKTYRFVCDPHAGMMRGSFRGR
jgi:plastocyanin